MAQAKKDIPQIALDTLKEVKERSRWLGNWAYVKGNGSTKIVVGAPCYAGWNSAGAGTKYLADYPFVDKERSLDTEYTKAEVLQYIDAWVNRSFISRCFHPIRKNAEAIYEGGSVLDCSFPAQAINIACIGLRYTVEHPHLIRNWIKLVDHCGEDEAFFLMHRIQYCEEGDLWCPALDIGHAWYMAQLGKKALKRTLSDKLRWKQLPSFSTNPCYYGVDKMWVVPARSQSYNCVPAEGDDDFTIPDGYAKGPQYNTFGKLIQKKDRYGFPITLNAAHSSIDEWLPSLLPRD